MSESAMQVADSVADRQTQVGKWIIVYNLATRCERLEQEVDLLSRASISMRAAIEALGEAVA